MKKILFILLILLISIPIVSAGNNTTEVTNPTTFHSDLDTVTALESGDSNISFSDGYKGYCVEWGEHSAEENETFYVDDTSRIINKETHKDVSNYIKTMFLFFYNETQKNPIATQHMIWKFTDNKQFSQFNNTWYEQIVLQAEKTRIPDSGTISINSTHQMVFEFRAFLSEINEYQNYFGYKFYIQEIKYNSTVQINNSTTNNNITLSSNICFNQTDIQFNEVTIKEKEKRATQSISTPLIKHICGINIGWLFGWIVILLILILLFYKKN